jgi:uncharacterized protein YjdB
MRSRNRADRIAKAIFSARRVRLLPGVIALALIVTPKQSSAQSIKWGDVNGDGSVGAVDAQAILSAVVGLPLPTSFNSDAGDANCDVALGAIDAQIVLSNVVGLNVSQFCVGTPRTPVANGSVKDAVSSAPISGAVVTLLPVTSGAAASTASSGASFAVLPATGVAFKTDANGAYTIFNNVPAGQYQILVKASGFTDNSAPMVSVSTGTVTRVDFALPSATSTQRLSGVNGRVTDANGQALEAVSISLRIGNATGTLVRTVQTNSDGAYSITAIPLDDANGNAISAFSILAEKTGYATKSVVLTSLTANQVLAGVNFQLAAGPTPVATVAVTIVPPTVAVGSTAQATAVLKDANDLVLTGRTLSWSSANTAVATVDAATGVITGAAAGTSVISATSEGKTGTATMTVTAAPVAVVSVTLASSTITVGATTQASAVVKDAAGNVLSGRTIAWSSGTPSVASVDPKTGVVTAVAAGTSVISATSEGKTAGATITVTARVSQVVIRLDTYTNLGDSVAVGFTRQARAEAKDADGNVLSGKTVSWSTETLDVATVDPIKGVVTGIGPGSVNIIATVDGVRGQLPVYVFTPLDPATALAGLWVAFTQDVDGVRSPLPVITQQYDLGTPPSGACPLGTVYYRRIFTLINRQLTFGRSVAADVNGLREYRYPVTEIGETQMSEECQDKDRHRLFIAKLEMSNTVPYVLSLMGNSLPVYARVEDSSRTQVDRSYGFVRFQFCTSPLTCDNSYTLARPGTSFEVLGAQWKH